MKRRILLERLISSLMCKEGSADREAAADDDRDVVKKIAKEQMTLTKDQLSAVSTEPLLIVLLDVLLLRLLDEIEKGQGLLLLSSASDAASDQQLMDYDAAAAKKKKKRAAAAAKKKRNKQNKAAAMHKQINLMSWSWLGGGIISLIMMVEFSSITTLIFPLSLIHQSDGSGDGKAPPALPPSASRPLRQEDLTSDNEASTLPNIISSPVAAVTPPPVFSPTDVAAINRRMKFDEKSAALFSSPRSPSSPTMSADPAQSCVDTPGWKDMDNSSCDWYNPNPNRCPKYVDTLGRETGSAKEHCCCCGGGSRTVSQTRSLLWN